MSFKNLTDIEREARQEDVETFIVESVRNAFKLMKPIAHTYLFENQIAVQLDNPFNQELLVNQITSHADYVKNDLKDWRKIEQLEIIEARTAALQNLIKLYQAKKDELLQ